MRIKSSPPMSHFKSDSEAEEAALAARTLTEKSISLTGKKTFSIQV